MRGTDYLRVGKSFEAARLPLEVDRVRDFYNKADYNWKSSEN